MVALTLCATGHISRLAHRREKVLTINHAQTQNFLTLAVQALAYTNNTEPQLYL